MKLSILLAGSILTSAIVGNVYAQTCGAQPSCSSLGYTYTGSTSDCVNTPMKCPFNTTYFNCVKKTEVLDTMELDFSQQKKISSGYTVPKNGMILGSIRDITNYGSVFKVNNFNISLTSVKDQRATVYFPVKAGDYIIMEGREIDVYFVPFAGN